MRFNSVILILSITFVLIFGQTEGRGEDGASVTSSIIKNSSATQARLESEPAVWSIILIGPDGSKSRIEVQKRGAVEKWTYFSDGVVEAASIIVRDGFWYVTDRPSGTQIKCYPYEAIFSVHSVYSSFASRNLRFLNAASGTPDENDGTTAVYHLPVSGGLRRQMEFTLEQLRIMAREKPSISTDIKKLEQTLKDGIPMKVDVKTGVISEITSAQLTRRSTLSFQEIPSGVFDIAGIQWLDRTTEFPLNESTVLMGMNGDPVLLSTRTMALRRVPYAGLSCSPGCIMRKKSSVIVSTADSGGVSQLVEINLATRENKLLGAAELAGQMCFNPAPAGTQSKIIFAAKGSQSGRMDLSQPWLMDLDTGKLQKLGEPFDCVSFSWLQDDHSVITAKREHQKLSDKTYTAMLCRLDLDGTLTPLCPGDNPVVLPGLKRILFQDSKTKNWWTCDFEGKNLVPFGDGFSTFSYPATSLDGTQLLMLDDNPRNKHSLLFVDPLSFKTNPVFDDEPRSISRPRWR